MSMPAKAWTLEELHRLPDDGNKYEVIRGELFVTPPPSVDHEELLARLHVVLAGYVEKHRVGRVYRPRAVIRFERSEAEPDLLVRPLSPGVHGNAWEQLPAPLLVVEALSPTTRRRDLVNKREYYLDAGAGEYWVLDGERQEIRVIRRGEQDVVARDSLVWPVVADEPLVLDVVALFGSLS
jgi:Uma2 family endonuclease